MRSSITSFTTRFLVFPYLGVTSSMDENEKRKLAVFNIFNFFAALSGIIIPLTSIFKNDNLSVLAWIIACSPLIISVSVLASNYWGKYEVAKMIYFIFYPVITSLAYAASLNLGIGLIFVFYGVLAIYLLNNTTDIFLSLCLSMTLYFFANTVWNDYDFQLSDLNYNFFLFTHFLATLFILFSFLLFKNESHGYQYGLLTRNVELEKMNREIEQQRKEIQQKAELLEKQTHELKELDALKNRLFSIISHDLRTPLYALRNLFRNIEKYDIPGDEIKTMIPGVVTDLNYTTGLMENLLQWTKSQMQATVTKPQHLDISVLIQEVIQLLRLQAEAKQVYTEVKIDEPIYIYADKDMISLVLRNLLSNAIKFTHEKGQISIGAYKLTESCVEIFVQDTGMGMNSETLQKINENNFFTTKGTANESGTGIGLLLCRDFLAKNGGRMFVESEQGKGSTFSFTLPANN